MKETFDTVVFRLENEQGRGPYTSNLCLTLGYGYDDYIHPVPQEDGFSYDVVEMLEINSFSEYLFGFQSMYLFKRWFNKQFFGRLNDLLDAPSDHPFGHRLHHEQGWCIAVYTVDKTFVHLGNTQCVFKSTEATRLITYPLWKRT